MATRVLAAAVLSLTLAGGSALAGNKDVCVSISDMYRGRNCGTGDSVQIDLSNQCGVKVKGVVIFHQASGDPIRQSVVLESGNNLTVFACHGNGKVDKDFSADR